MQRSISMLIILIASAMPTAVSAQTTGVAPTNINPNLKNQVIANQVSPFNLAYLAYQGYLENQGIPSADALINAIVFKTVTAQDVMQAAVKANRLPESTLNDRGYRFALEDQLQGLKTE
jgi:hypothetical protein